jgi:peptidoglycan-N-acetylglucosamine deacetylase
MISYQLQAIKHFILTVDVEDWFQVENLRPWYPHGTWSDCELRVERNVHRLLDLFDELCTKFHNSTTPINPLNPADPTNPHTSISATFFVLGWIAERLPRLVREIAARGHEVASHGHSHRMCNSLSNEDLKEDLVKSKSILEDILGQKVSGFRAPNFSIDDRVLSLVADSGYAYDSSYNNFNLHGRYGKINLTRQPMAGIAYRLSDSFFELPISNLPFISFPILGLLGMLARYRRSVIPWGGGAYFRLVPRSIFCRGVRRILELSGAYSFYIHPWEIDPDQPKIRHASFISRFKHYTNLKETESKLRSMIQELADCRFSCCRDYIGKSLGLTAPGVRARVA